jgi:hypothetical protein
LISSSTEEALMKFTVPGIALAALIVASPAAFAQNTSTGNASTPGASIAKDDTTKATMTKRSKKHTASYKHKHHAKAMNSKAMKSKAQTTGSGSNTTKPEKDDTTPKSK